LIRLAGVSRVFGTGPARVPAVHDVDLEIDRGEFVALAGPSGSGKTSLLNLIGALDTPGGGRLWLDGEELGALDERRRATLRLHKLGFVFQQFNLVPVLTAAENVELPLLFRRDLAASERTRRTAAALEAVGLATHRDRRPAELSGGEQQRVAVARAVAGTPAVVLADEPTANLDRSSGAAVIRLLQRLNREAGTTFLYATHDAELIALADRVIWMRDGRITGPPT
jgi:putative ABC transport system ATP-binding protein